MFKRVVAFLVALPLMFVSSSAWTAESFVGNDYSAYEISDDTVSRPIMMAANGSSLYSSSYSESLSGLDFFSRLSLKDETVSGLVQVYHPAEIVAGVSVPSWTEYRTSPVGGVVPNVAFSSDNFFLHGSLSLIDNLNSGEYQGLYGFCVPPFDGPAPVSSLRYSLNLSDLSSFYSFEISGSLFTNFFYSETGVLPYSLDLYINNALFRTFYIDSNLMFDFGHLIVDFSNPINSVDFVVNYSPQFLTDEESVTFGFNFSSSNISFTVLSGSDALGGMADNTQSDINELDSYESEWGSSMTENFNSLKLGDLKFSGALGSAMALISGIFQDIWYAFGDYKIYFVFPLTLGIVMLVIGRLSRVADFAKKYRGGEQ